MMYRIMVVKSKRENYGSLYQFMTTTIDGVTMPLEITTKEELDAKIEKMLNEGGFAKDGFIVVHVVDYNIDVDIVPSNSDLQDSSIQSDWQQNDAENPAYIRNRPFYKEQAAVDYVKLSADGIDSETSIGLYGKKIGLEIGQVYTVNLIQTTGETVTIECTCADIAEDLELSDVTVPALGDENGQFTIYDGIDLDADGNPEITDNAVYAFGSSTVSEVIIHGAECIAEVIHKIPNEFLDVDTAFNANSHKPQSGKAVAQGIKKSLTDSIDNLSIDTNHLADNSVTTDKLIDNSITEAKLAENSVSEKAIQDGAITPKKLSENSIMATAIRSGAVTHPKLAKESVWGENLEKPSILGSVTITEPTAIIQPKTVEGYGVSDRQYNSIVLYGSICSTDPEPQVLIISHNPTEINQSDVAAKIPLDFSKTNKWNVYIRMELGLDCTVKVECTSWGYDLEDNYIENYCNDGQARHGNFYIEYFNYIYLRFGNVNSQQFTEGTTIYSAGIRSV